MAASKTIERIISIMMVFTTIFEFFGISAKISVQSLGKKQVIDGWGTSACWWSQMIDDEDTRKELAKELYSEEGLALNIYRYNVGGGVNPEYNRVGDPWRNTESFYYFNEESGQYEYDFTRDANAQAFLKEALSYGCIDTVILFANSPHYSMTVSGQSSGSYYGEGTTNLDKEHYQDFVDYFLTITEYFISEGVPVKYISPINEPQWDWGGDWVGQEGCHYDPDQVYELLALFSKGIDERGLDVKLSCPDSGGLFEPTQTYFDSIKDDPELYKNVGAFAYHSYWSDNDSIGKMAFGEWRNSEKYKDDKFEMTEWCELPCQHDVTDSDGAVMMARVIANDINYCGANSWSSWVAVNKYGVNEDGKTISDGLFYAEDDFSSYYKAMRYNALAHFSKFVPAGSVVLRSWSSINPKTEDGWLTTYKLNLCSFKTPDKKIVTVIVNEDEEKDVRLGVLSRKMSVYTTDSEHQLDETYSGRYKRKITLPENSITTVVFER